MPKVSIPKGSTQYTEPTQEVNGHDKTAHKPTPPKGIFPTEVFPKDIQQFVRRVADDLGYEADFMAGSILAAVSAAVGRSYVLKLRPNWIESAVLWLCLVGRPGSGKSHPQKSALAPIFRRDKQLYAEYREAKQAYEEYKNLPKVDKENTAEVPEPTLRKHTVSDITLEALAQVLTSNKVLLHADEFGGWLSNFNRYTPGSDTECWLTLWSGGALTVDRVSKEPIRIDDPYCSVSGTTQPGVLESLFKDKTDNGLTDRILFVWPDEIKAKTWQDNDVDPAIFTPYNRAITKLLDERPEGTNELRFTADASQLFGQFYTELQQRIVKEQSERTQSLLSKLDIHCARLSLTLQMLRYACGEGENTHVDITSVRSGIQLANYFEGRAVKVREHLFERSPVDEMDKKQQQFYSALEPLFKTSEAVDTGTKKYNYSERYVKKMLNERKLFCKISHGVYEKLY